MLRQSSRPLIRWCDTAVACRSDLCVMLTSQSRVRRTQLCSLCLFHGPALVVDPRKGILICLACVGVLACWF